jgi:thymidylate synthase
MHRTLLTRKIKKQIRLHKDKEGKMSEEAGSDRAPAIPALSVCGITLPDAWEKSVLAVWEGGNRFPTEYDQEGESPSLDATMMLVVEKPFDEPRIHRAFPGAVEDLEKYRLEVVEGVHDHWIRPEEGKWTYTYHKRLFDYEVRDDIAKVGAEGPFVGVAQIDYMVEKLSQVPHTRRAQAITWMPTLDPKTDDPPCLQRLWCRLVKDEAGKFFLQMNTHWRSRDAYKAAFMNMYALTDLQRVLASRISERTGRSVRVGRYVDITDSYHIYGSYLEEIRERFLRSIRDRSFEERTWRSDNPIIVAGLRRGREQLEQERQAEGE